MDQRAKRLTIGVVAVALFVGFIFLTRWTGDDPHSVKSFDDAEKADLARFCIVFSGDYVPYETVIRVAVGQPAPGAASGGQGGDLGNASSFAQMDFLQGILRNLADSVP